MYRLMIVTDSTQTKEHFEQFPSWINNGFKAPHYRDSKIALIDGFSKHHVDGIAIELSSLEETEKVKKYLDEEHPLVPIFKISKNIKEQNMILEGLRKVLDKINADYSDDEFSAEQRFEQVRNKWFSRFLNGRASTYDELCQKNDVFRLNMLLDLPCAFIELSIPSGEEYLSAQWHYGTERLEVALRNFFQNNGFTSNAILAVQNPTKARLLLVCNCDTAEICKNALRENNGKIKDYLNNCISDIQQYLNLTITIDSINVLPNVVAVNNIIK